MSTFIVLIGQIITVAENVLKSIPSDKTTSKNAMVQFIDILKSLKKSYEIAQTSYDNDEMELKTLQGVGGSNNVAESEKVQAELDKEDTQFAVEWEKFKKLIIKHQKEVKKTRIELFKNTHNEADQKTLITIMNENIWNAKQFDSDQRRLEELVIDEIGRILSTGSLL
jgi:hypothetical protein